NHFKSLPRNHKLHIHKNFNVWRVLALLVESGAVYGVIQSPDLLSFSSVNDVTSLTLYLIHGPFSLAGTHESLISAVISEDLRIPSQERPGGEVLA
ncbi:hypothetical protein H0H93_006821, partial [Arthromyces matolae]